MATAIVIPIQLAINLKYVVKKETKMNKKFVGPDGQVFVVDEVVQTPAGLTVFYVNEATQQKYSCLIDAFSERFKELTQ